MLFDDVIDVLDVVVFDWLVKVEMVDLLKRGERLGIYPHGSEVGEEGVALVLEVVLENAGLVVEVVFEGVEEEGLVGERNVGTEPVEEGVELDHFVDAGAGQGSVGDLLEQPGGDLAFVLLELVSQDLDSEALVEGRIRELPRLQLRLAQQHLLRDSVLQLSIDDPFRQQVGTYEQRHHQLLRDLALQHASHRLTRECLNRRRFTLARNVEFGQELKGVADVLQGHLL